MTQLRPIEILLRKCIPDLAAAEIKSEQTHSYVIEIPAVLTREQWLEKYGKCDKQSDWSISSTTTMTTSVPPTNLTQ